MIGKTHRMVVLGVAVSLIAGTLVGCAEVQPWQKEHLARPHMAFEPDPLQARSREHLFTSKEASSGGYGVGGGGCGCN